MADNSVVQTIKDAEVDARSLSEFISKDANFMVERRIAPSVHTLDYYLKQLEEFGFNVVGTFEGGVTLTEKTQSIRFAQDGLVYKWNGSLPKTVAEDSTPQATGGIGGNAWQVIGIPPANATAEGIEYKDGTIASELDKIENSRKSVNINLGVNTARACFQFDTNNQRNIVDIITGFDSVGHKASLAVPIQGVNGLVGGGNLTVDVHLLKEYQDGGHDIISHGVIPAASYGQESFEQMDADADFSYELLRQAGIRPAGFVCYSGGLNRNLADYYIKRHGILFAANSQADERDIGLATLGDETELFPSVTRVSMEGVILSDGSSSNSSEDILRVCKKVADYCLTHNRSVVFYHHNPSGGGLTVNEILELTQYCESIGVIPSTTTEVFQDLSNITYHGARIEALERDMQQSYGLVHENLLEDSDMTNWKRYDSSGTPAEITKITTRYADRVDLKYLGDNVEGEVATSFVTHINDLGSYEATKFLGVGGALTFGFEVTADKKAYYGEGFTVEVVARFRALNNGSGNIQPREISRVFSNFETIPRRVYVNFSNTSATQRYAENLELLVRITPKSGNQGRLSIANPRLNRGIIPAQYIRATPSVNTLPVPVILEAPLSVSESVTWGSGNSLQPQYFLNIQSLTLVVRDAAGRIVGFAKRPYKHGETITIPCSANNTMTVAINSYTLTVSDNTGDSLGYVLSDVTLNYIA